MKLSVDVNLPSKAWRSFLESQPIEFPAYFERPLSADAMVYFKEMLEYICLRAIKSNSSTGVYTFIQAVQNDRARSLMFTWIDSYTPIRQIKTRKGDFEQMVIRSLVSHCSIVDGKTHPYFSLQPKPRKTHIFTRGLQQLNITNKDSELVFDTSRAAVSEFDTSRAAVSDLELSVKMAKMAFNQFIKDRSNESKKKLIETINSIPIGQVNKKGKPFLQGGAPG